MFAHAAARARDQPAHHRLAREVTICPALREFRRADRAGSHAILAFAALFQLGDQRFEIVRLVFSQVLRRTFQRALAALGQLRQGMLMLARQFAARLAVRDLVQVQPFCSPGIARLHQDVLVNRQPQQAGYSDRPAARPA